MPVKAVIFDYIGTLVNCKGYSMVDSEDKLYSALVAEGFKMEKHVFLEAYHAAHQKYRVIRYEQHREVTNAIWVSEALRNIGFKAEAKDSAIKTALNVFFQDFINTLELRVGAKKLLSQTKAKCKIGLISNFTHAPVIYKSLRKIGIDQFFNAVIISEENGWRKPNRMIFQDALYRLQVKPGEAVYVGDSPVEDIKGAKDLGLKTIFVTSQFNKLKDLREGKQEPTCIARSLLAVGKNLDQILP